MKTQEYYQIVKKLQKWQEKERLEGSNYVTKTYIETYEAELERLVPTPKNDKLKLDPPKTKEEMEEEYRVVIKKLVKKLKRKIESGKGDWQDMLMLDVFSGKPKNEWRLPL